MSPKWVAINLCLLATLAGAGFLLFENYARFTGAAETSVAVAEGNEKQEGEAVDLPDAVAFRVKVDALCREEAVLVEPGAPLRFTLRPTFRLPRDVSPSLASFLDASPGAAESIQVEWKSVGGGTLTAVGDGRYEYAPPDSGGDVELKFRARYDFPEGARIAGTLRGSTTLRLLCPVPWEAMDEAERASIGRFPTIGKNSKLAPYRETYRPPTHFYRVTQENEDLKISPHFRLGDFDLRFEHSGDLENPLNRFPQYIALHSRLVVKLEEILAGLEEHGVEADTLGILAGFRSPAYNDWKKEQGGIGGKYTKGLSTHMYGYAADFFVDRDGDGAMDDMNGDGAIDQKDSAWIRDLVVDRVDCQSEISGTGLAGMCGIYGTHDIPDRAIQTPNLHIDIRGYSTNRWYIDKKDRMITDWQYWERNSCEDRLSDATGSESSG